MPEFTAIEPFVSAGELPHRSVGVVGRPLYLCHEPDHE